jgi:transposase
MLDPTTLCASSGVAWLIGMEACVGAHHRQTHDARLMPAKYVRPYSNGQKNDFNDAALLVAE